MPSELRRSPRYIFFASAEVTDAASESTMNAHTSELCRHGCYLDMMNPFLDGTALRVRITHEGQAVDAAARVIHSNPTSAWESASTRSTRARNPSSSSG